MTFQGKVFKVEAGQLGFTVVVFCIGAVFSILLLLARRLIPALGRAELGGPRVAKAITSGVFFVMWFGYVIVSSLQAYDHITVDIKF